MKNVWFIRHAESEANAGLPTADPGLIALTSKGHEQAEFLADIINVVPDLVVCSSYIRTQQTAQPLLDKYSHVQTLVWPIHEFDFLSPKSGFAWPGYNLMSCYCDCDGWMKPSG